jgi:hypothetical protein
MGYDQPIKAIFLRYTVALELEWRRLFSFVAAFTVTGFPLNIRTSSVKGSADRAGQRSELHATCSGFEQHVKDRQCTGSASLRHAYESVWSSVVDFCHDNPAGPQVWSGSYSSNMILY